MKIMKKVYYRDEEYEVCLSANYTLFGDILGYIDINKGEYVLNGNLSSLGRTIQEIITNVVIKRSHDELRSKFMLYDQIKEYTEWNGVIDCE